MMREFNANSPYGVPAKRGGKVLVDLEMSRPDEVATGSCNLCRDTGHFTWQQPVPQPDGTVFREMSHPCIRGCSGWWRQPAAEMDQVVEGDVPPSVIDA